MAAAPCFSARPRPPAGRSDDLQPQARLRVGMEDLPGGREQASADRPWLAAGEGAGVGEPEQAIGRCREGREIRGIVPIADRSGPADAAGIAAQVLGDRIRDATIAAAVAWPWIFPSATSTAAETPLRRLGTGG